MANQPVPVTAAQALTRLNAGWHGRTLALASSDRLDFAPQSAGYGLGLARMAAPAAWAADLLPSTW
jgi:hypothetical protein